MASTNEKPLTEDEIKLYDRQIRLWGVKAQGNLRNAKILLINLTSTGVEICKNLVLGGIGSLTITDGSTVLDQDLRVNFFLERSQVGQKKTDACQKRIQELNPRVDLHMVGKDWQKIDDIETFIGNFNMVIATGLNGDEITKLNHITRKLNLPLFCASTHGLFGFIFTDLIDHFSTVKFDKASNKKVGPINEVTIINKVEEGTENEKPIQICTVESKYRPYWELSGDFLKKRYTTVRKQIKRISVLLPAFLALMKLPSYLNKPIEEVAVSSDDITAETSKILTELGLPSEILTRNKEKVRQLAQQAYCGYQPVSSILGGTVAQDVINALVHKEIPTNNVAVLDGYNSEIPVYIM